MNPSRSSSLRRMASTRFVRPGVIRSISLNRWARYNPMLRRTSKAHFRPSTSRLAFTGQSANSTRNCGGQDGCVPFGMPVSFHSPNPSYGLQLISSSLTLRGHPMLNVHLDSWLREFGPSGKETVDAATVVQLLDVLEGRYPRLRFKVRDETGQLRRYVRVFVDGEDISGTTGVATALASARTIDILHSIAGG